MNTSRLASVALAAFINLAPIAHRVLPAMPNAASAPAAILFKWIIGLAAFAGSMHAVSAATAKLASASSVNGTNGVRLSYQIRINDGQNRQPGSWTIGGKAFSASGSTTNGMPPGLSMALSTAIISGVPTQTGDFPTTLTAWENSGQRGAKLTFTVTFHVLAGASPPTITTAPVGGSATEGDAFTFSVSATGGAPLRYQWAHDSTALPGATNNTLILSPVALADAGAYTVTVTNANGSATSPAVSLIVNPKPNPPGIATPPVGGNGTEGGAFTFSVVATGDAPLSYQWFHEASAITTGTNATLVLSPLNITDAGAYKVRIENGAGSLTSTPVVLTVTPAVVPTSISKQPAAVSLHVGERLAIEVGAAGTPPLAFVWKRDGATVGTSTNLLVIPAATAADAGDYSVEVSGPGGVVPSASAKVRVVAVSLGTPALAGGKLQVAATTIPGRKYVAESSPDPVAGPWTSAGEFTADADTTDLTETVGTETAAFWRYRTLP